MELVGNDGRPWEMPEHLKKANAVPSRWFDKSATRETHLNAYAMAYR
ncbi:hypothetical protein [Variovorax sp. J22R115]|nr:hypothetical protein [Variovorax sp. J22R115]MDM0047856.1 hypothetical protein [Variovorax sp. J22R115]